MIAPDFILQIERKSQWDNKVHKESFDLFRVKDILVVEVILTILKVLACHNVGCLRVHWSSY